MPEIFGGERSEWDRYLLRFLVIFNHVIARAAVEMVITHRNLVSMQERQA